MARNDDAARRNGQPAVVVPLRAAAGPAASPAPALASRARVWRWTPIAEPTDASPAPEPATVEISAAAITDAEPHRISLVKPQVSLVKPRPMLSHPRTGLDEIEAEPEPEAEEPPPPSFEPDPTLRYVSQVMTILAVVALGTLLQLTLLGGLQHSRDQAQAFAEFRIALAVPTAPVGPIGDDGQVLPAGTPVAIVEIPAVGVNEVVLEGSTSRVTMSGPGHRRDSVLPGQAGTSIIIGRRGGYGGPFKSLDQLRLGDEIIATTGQGRHTFTVVAVRRVGDPLPAPLAQGKGRLTLTTTDGPTFQPTDALRIDADLTSDVQDAGPRIPSRALPPNEAVFAGDSSALLPLMLWGPLLIAASAGLVYVRHRVGRRQSWIIGVPVLVLLGLAVMDDVIALLPNIL